MWPSRSRRPGSRSNPIRVDPTAYGRKSPMVQQKIRVDDGVAYEQMMGVWSVGARPDHTRLTFRTLPENWKCAGNTRPAASAGQGGRDGSKDDTGASVARWNAGRRWRHTVDDARLYLVPQLLVPQVLATQFWPPLLHWAALFDCTFRYFSLYRHEDESRGGHRCGTVGRPSRSRPGADIHFYDLPHDLPP
jgi:hypothetical protein